MRTAGKPYYKMSEHAVRVLSDIEGYYKGHRVAVLDRWVGTNGEDLKTPEGAVAACIWGAAIATGHARNPGSYGTGLDPSVNAALVAAAKDLWPTRPVADVGSIGGINDSVIRGDKRLMRRWLAAAKRRVDR